MITDEVYEHLVFDGHATCRWPTIPGMAEPDDHHLERGQDVQCHRLEDRMGLRRSRTHHRCAGGQAVSELCRRCAVPARGGPGAEHRGRLGGRAAGVVAGQARPAGQALVDIGFDVHDSFGTYFLCADPRPLGYDDSTTFCAELPEKAGVAAIPMSAFCESRRQPSGITWCASRSANATTPSTRPSAGWQCCVASVPSR